MGSVVARAEDQPFGPTPAEAAVRAAGGVETRRILGGPDRPIWLWMHRLRPGASLAWDRPRQDHLIYVWDGVAHSRDQPLRTDEAFVVEHGGQGEITAPEGAVVMHFHRPEDYPEPAARAGGHVHLLAGCAVRRGADPHNDLGISLFADAACPSCEVWLHGNQYPPGYRVGRHYHSEDEVIVVTGGVIQLGRVEYGRGAVIAVDADTRYGFTAGPDGMSFVNYRPASPTYSRADNPEPKDERTLLLNMLARSRPVAA